MSKKNYCKVFLLSFLFLGITSLLSACDLVSKFFVKNENEISLVVTNKIYDSKPIEVRASSLSNEDITLKYKSSSGEDYFYTAPTNAGTYTVYASTEGNEEYNSCFTSATFTIHKAYYDMSNVKWNYSDTFVYDNTEKEVLVTGLPNGVSVSSYTGNTATEVGTYEALVSLNYDNTNYHEPTVSSLSWEIAEKTLLNNKITINVIDKTYNGKPIEVSASSLSNEDITLKYKSTSGEDYFYTAPIDAGTYTVYASTSGNEDYNSCSTSATFTIYKAYYDMSNAKWNYSGSFLYDGSEKEVLVIGLPNGVSVASYTNNKAKEVGTYEALVSLNYDTTNYHEPSVSSLSWEITEILTIKQTSTNYVNTTLNNVQIDCDKHDDCTLEWENGSQLIKNAHGYYNVKHTSSNGTTKIYSVEVNAIAVLDSNYCFQDMIFTLKSYNKTASVKSNSKSITKAIIPAYVSYDDVIYTVDCIDSMAFANIDTLIEVYVPKTIVDYYASSFAANSNLTNVELDDELEVLGNAMFSDCPKLNSITIPSGVTAIPNSFLRENKLITSINIPEGVKKIGNNAFYNCGIESIDLPEGLLIIEDYAFYNNNFTSITFPSTLTSIGNNAFKSNELLEKVVILSKDITLGTQAFTNCEKLNSVYFSSETLLNSITSNTTDTNYLLAYLENNDIIYIKDTINITSNYIKELFIKVSSDVEGYDAYQYKKYAIVSIDNMKNRIYTLNSSLYGDEIIKYKDNDNTLNEQQLYSSMIEFFDTSSEGKKIAKIIYKFEIVEVPYVVLSSATSTSMNAIVNVNNFKQTYYVNESISLNDVTINYCSNNAGYYKCNDINVTNKMVSGFSTSATGTYTLTLSYQNSEYSLTYYVREVATEKITSSSFQSGIYYATDTTEETEHFTIKISANSYLASNYKDIIEKIYDTEKEILGITSNPEITIEVDENNYPSCSGTTLHLRPDNLLFIGNSTFIHELAHALDHSTQNCFYESSTVSEGFATYVEYLTVRYFSLHDTEMISYVGSPNKVIYNVSFLEDNIYFYDFETYLLYLERDELVINSQYEVGSRFFAYLDYRYGDICGWKTLSTNDNSTEAWISIVKKYYDNENIFEEMYDYLEKYSYQFYFYLGFDSNNILKYETTIDFSNVYKTDYYFNLSESEKFRGYNIICYKDLYINIASAKDQLAKMGIQYNDLTLSINKNITIELYDKTGNLINTIYSTISPISLNEVSFIKLVGTDIIGFDLQYS